MWPIPLPASLLVFVACWLLGWLALRVGAWPAVRRRALRGAVFIAMAALPLATGGPGPVQLFIGIGCVFLAIRVAGLAARFPPGTPPPTLARTLHLLAVWPEAVEPPPVPRRTGPALELGLLACAVSIGLIYAGSRIQIWRTWRLLDDLLVVLEVGIGVAGLNNVVVGIWSARGRQTGGFQDRPLLSSSFADFWGRRWNRLVSVALDRALFRPLVRRGHPALGVAAAFAASGLLHAVPVLAAGPLPWAIGPALVVFSFFAINAAIVFGERRLGLDRRPPAGPRLFLARARFAVLFVALSPLLLDVYADICGIHGRPFGP